MFFCIGENANTQCSVGKGKTIDEAVSNWTSFDANCDTAEMIKEWCEYAPIIIAGDEIKAGLKYEFIAT